MKSTLNAMLCLLPTFCAQSTILAKVFIIFAQNLLIAERRKRCAYRWHTQIVEYVCITARCSSSAHHIFLRKTVCSLSISAVLIEITSEENLLWRTYLRTCYIWACVVCASGTVFNATIWSYINHESWWYFGKWYEVYCRTGDISHILHSVNAQIEWQFSSKVWLDNNKSERRFKMYSTRLSSSDHRCEPFAIANPEIVNKKNCWFLST